MGSSGCPRILRGYGGGVLWSTSVHPFWGLLEYSVRNRIEASPINKSPTVSVTHQECLQRQTHQYTVGGFHAIDRWLLENQLKAEYHTDQKGRYRFLSRVYRFVSRLYRFVSRVYRFLSLQKYLLR